MIQEPSEFTTTTTTTTPTTTITPTASKPSHDIDKAKMIESEKPLKKKDQIMYDQEFEVIKDMFDKAFKRVNTFVDYKTELFKGSEKKVEDSTKRADIELEQEVAKKQKIDNAKVDDDQEKDRMKELMNIVPNEEEVAINVIPLATKPPCIYISEVAIYAYLYDGKEKLQGFVNPNTIKSVRIKLRLKVWINKTHVRTKEQSDSLIDKLNLKSTKNEDLKAQIQDKVFVITSLKNDLRKLKGKEIVDIVAQIRSANTIFLSMFKLDLEPLAPRLLQNREVHIEYLKYAQEQADILRGIIHALNAINLSAKKVVGTPKNKDKKVRSKPTSNKRNDRISQTPSRNMKNKVEAQPRKINKKNRVVEPIRDINVKHSLLNANSEPICATCRTFTIVGNSYRLTRITSANAVLPKKTTFDSVETQKPVLKVYSRKPKNVKNVGSSKKAKIVESKNANHSESNHTWGSNATDIPSSSSLVMTGCPNFSLVSGLRMFETHDREPLSDHELC
ncbi:hypothetical protein Tco_1356363 [Tanacetum coccineum]